MTSLTIFDNDTSTQLDYTSLYNFLHIHQYLIQTIDTNQCLYGNATGLTHPSNTDLGLVRTRRRPPGPPRRAREESPGFNRTPQGGVAAGAFTSSWTRASHRRISPWSPLRGFVHGTGVRRCVYNNPTLGAPGARHPDDCTTGQAGGAWGGWPPPDQTLAPGLPGSTGPRPGIGPQGLAQ